MDDIIERVLMIVADIVAIVFSLLVIYLGISIWYAATVLIVKILISVSFILSGITLMFLMISLTILGW